MSEPDPRPNITDFATPSPQRRGWQYELSRAISQLPELLTAVGLDRNDPRLPALAEPAFPLRVPRGFVRRMRRGDPRDPLLLQVLPRAAEYAVTPGYRADPVSDLEHMSAPGLLQKYQGRALLVATGACAVHCRYCFRRHYPYGTASMTPRHIDTALGQVAADPAIAELILSGGDPLSLTDERLAGLFRRIVRIPHIRRIRIHTRQPIVLPERVTDNLCRIFADAGRTLVFVVHANHAQEIDADVGRSLRRLGAHGTLLNQSVLLRDINDDATRLAALSETLFEHGVLPYYLHQLDRVAGAAHFAVNDETARSLVAQLAARLPGYLVPKLVREVAGAPSKLPL